MRRKKIKIFKIENIVFTLMYISLIVIILNAKAMSKYTGRAASNGVATVAKWDVKIDNTLTSNNISIVGGTSTQNYTLSVTSESEVACTYSIVLSNVPNDVSVSIDGGTAKKASNNRITFENVGSFSANDIELMHEHTLTFSAPINVNAVTDNPINIDVKVEQKN